MRLNEGKLERVAMGSGEVGAHRNLRETAAERSSPVVEFASLGARFVVRREGNERGRGELLIATNGTSNDAIIGEKSRPAFLLCHERVLMVAVKMKVMTGGSHLS